VAPRIAGFFAVLCLAGCAGRPPAPTPPLLPLPAAWKTLLGEFVAPPLATDGRRIFVATRDGVVRALDPATGAVGWKAEGRPGALSAAEGVLLVRGEDGTLTSLHPRTGAARWTASTGVAGTMPAVVDGDRALVPGKGLAAVELAGGRTLWADLSGAETTAPPVSAGSRILAGEGDGTLRCRDRETGVPLWVARTGGALLAAPLVDASRRRVYLGTTDKRILEVDLDDGETGWAWRVGADVAHGGLLLPERVLFAAYDAVLYSLRPGGNLDWRASLPSRPLSPPLRVGDYLLLACLENEVVAYTPETGKPAGRLRTAAEIRTAPLLAPGGVVALGLRDRSVIAFALPGDAPPAPAGEPKDEPAEPAPAVAAPPSGR
jgi:outer membrane protein assembly factor BamB